MRLKLTIFSILFIAVYSCKNSTDSADKKSIQKALQSYQDAINNNRYDELVDMTYEAAYKGLSREEMIDKEREMLDSSNFQLKVEKLSADSISFVIDSADKYAVAYCEVTYRYKVKNTDSAAENGFNLICEAFTRMPGSIRTTCDTKNRIITGFVKRPFCLIQPKGKGKWFLIEVDADTEDVVPKKVLDKMGVEYGTDQWNLNKEVGWDKDSAH